MYLLGAGEDVSTLFGSRSSSSNRLLWFWFLFGLVLIVGCSGVSVVRQRFWPRFGRMVYRLREVESPVEGVTVVVRVRVTAGVCVVVVLVVVGGCVVVLIALLELIDLAVVRNSSFEVVSSMRFAFGIAVGL
uniref:(northern house mosquito) hypothetical protein n=1 Tax=Culex pipiens TaxID=7175 RepID=A0A8D8J0F1_CULPI